MKKVAIALLLVFIGGGIAFACYNNHESYSCHNSHGHFHGNSYYRGHH